MRNYIKIITINILSLIGLILVGDYIFFKYIEYNYRQDCIKQNIPFDYNIKYKTYEFINVKKKNTTNIYKSFLNENLFLAPIIPQNTNIKRPIILLGCSYTWLNNTDGLQGLLAKYSKRPVFNFSFWGWGGAQAYYLVNDPLFYEKINSYNLGIPEYIIYTYIRDHKNRITDVMDFFIDIEPYLNYYIADNELKIKEHNFIQKLIFRLFTYRYLYKKFEKNDNNYRYKILYNLLFGSYTEIKKHYPDIKFIILEYYQGDEEDKLEEEMLEKLQNRGIIFISTKNLTNENLKSKKYTEADGYHPNAYAWGTIVETLIKEIQI